MTDTFLNNCSDYLLEKHPSDLSKIALVFPNRRSGLFFLNSFSKKITTPVWVPQIFTIETFLEKATNQNITDDLTLLFTLYNAYIDATSDNLPFDEFLSWGNTLLNDFKDIDDSLVNPKDLFNNLYQIAAIENWNPGKPALTDFQKQYLKFWEHLPQVYQLFNKKLNAQTFCSSATLARKLANQFPENFFESLQLNKIYFIGFNMLTVAEEKIVKQLITQQKAEIIWDNDQYFTQNSWHEAGVGIKKFYQNKLHTSPMFTQNTISNNKQNIFIYGATGPIGQIKLLANYLNLKPQEYNQINTAIVLADENYIVPLLSSLPNEISAANISIGYPLKTSMFIGFIIQLIEVMQFAENRLQKNIPDAYLARNIIKLLNHDLIQAINHKAAEKIKEAIISNNWVFTSQQEIITQIKDNKEFETLYQFLNTIFNHAKKGSLNTILNLIKNIENHHLELLNPIEKEAFFATQQTFQKIELFFTKYPEINNNKSLVHLFNWFINKIKLPLIGEPLSGMQILGLLETRNLDFENVFILGANEGVLPAKKQTDSFIPNDLKAHFNLPNYTHSDSIYAFHFYRLIKRAKNVFLFYDALTKAFGSSEKSRYINQIMYEFPEKVKEHKIISLPFPKKSVRVLHINKTPQVHKKITNFLINQGISPSAINTYLLNPIEFYYRYIEGIGEEKTHETIIESSSLGTIIHEVLEDIYAPLIGKYLSAEYLTQKLHEIERLVHYKYLNHFGGKPVSGKNLLSKIISQKHIANVINYDITCLKTSKIKLINLELRLEYKLKIAPGIEVKCKGFIDRIDEYDEKLRIIDYKTGQTESKNVTLNSEAEMLNAETKAKALQLAWYAWLYVKNFTANEVLCGIISTKTSNKPVLLEIANTNLITVNEISAIQNQFAEILSEIYTHTIPFSEKEEKAYEAFYDI